MNPTDIHLRAEPNLDVTTTHGVARKFTVWLLRTLGGGSSLCGPPEGLAVCGTRPTRMVVRGQEERVTCGRCRAYIAEFVR